MSGRRTLFRVKQQSALSCTFQDFIPALKDNALANLRFDDYLAQFRSNVMQAGDTLIGGAFQVDSNALRKVEGDVFELLIAAVLWNIAADWNLYMESGLWESHLRCPLGMYPEAKRKIGIVKLPRGYDATKLLTPSARQAIKTLEELLRKYDMMLDLSSPDIVSVQHLADQWLTLSPKLHALMLHDHPSNIVVESSLRAGNICTKEISRLLHQWPGHFW